MNRRWVLLLVLWVSACETTVPEPSLNPDESAQIVWPEPPEPPRIRYVAQFSNASDLGLNESLSRKMRNFLAGKDDYRMTRPYSVAVNNNKIVVADPGLAVVHIFNTDRKTYRRLDRAGETKFVSPIGVAIAGDGIFVADSELHAVFALDSKFELSFSLEEFQRPTSLAFDPLLQRLYVADTLAHEISVFDQAGQFLFKFGQRGEQDGQFNYPSHLSFNKDQLLVNDTMNFRIQIFSPNGQHLKTFGKHGNGSGHFVQPKGVAVDSDDHIYVADALTNQVQIFDQDGAFLLGFGSDGDRAGAFMMPAGLTILDDKIYVADSHNQRVQVFRYVKEVR